MTQPTTTPARARSPRATPTPTGAPSGTAQPRQPAAAQQQYNPGTPNGGGGGRVHPAQKFDGALSPAGHRAYCAKNIEDALKGAGGVSQHSADTRKGIKKSAKLTWAQKQLALRRNKRADRKVIAAQQALAKAWLGKAKTREAVDAEINAAKKTKRPASGTYTSE